MIGKTNIGGENLNTQLTAQETLIQTITESLVGKATLANATADKIIEGFCAYVGQQLIQGTAKDPTKLADLKSAGGFAKMAIDKFTPASRTSISGYNISHSLGETAKIAMLLSDSSRSKVNSDVVLLISKGEYFTYGLQGYFQNGIFKVEGANCFYVNGGDSEKITLAASGSYTYYYLTAGVEYTLITLA